MLRAPVLPRNPIRVIIATLDDQIAELDAEIQKTINDDDDLKGKRDLIESINGIGPTTSATILAETPHIEKFASAKALTAFAGVCPQLRQSGKSVSSSRTTKIGNREIRKALYMAALSARRFNPVIKAFADRLQERGKKNMEIIVAVMRKLLVLVFKMLKTGRPFDPAWTLT